jgi:hypothetical protein
MPIDRKLLIIAGTAAVVALVVAIFSLREDPVTPSGPPPENHPSIAGAESAASATTNQAPLSQASAQADYFPLSDAFRLNYLVEVSSKGDPPIRSPDASAMPSRFGIARVVVEGRETIRAKEYYKVVLHIIGISGMREPVVRYCRNAGDAWHELDGSRKDNPAFEAITLPLPPRVGAAWDKDTPEARSNWKVEGTEPVVLSGKQHSNCLRISYERRLKDEPDYFETGQYYLAPNIGLIKQVAMVSGTRISFTLDDRTPEAIAVYSTWAGTYAGVSGRGGTTGGRIQLFADGRYTMIRSWADSAVNTGTYERNPNRNGEMIFRDASGISMTYTFRRSDTGPGGGVLHLKSVSEGNLLQEEFVRDAPSR